MASKKIDPLSVEESPGGEEEEEEERGAEGEWSQESQVTERLRLT